MQNEPADRTLGRDRDGDPGAERLAEWDQARCRIARRRKIIGGPRIVKQPEFARTAGRSAEAAIRQRDKPGAVGNELAEAVGAIA